MIGVPADETAEIFEKLSSDIDKCDYDQAQKDLLRITTLPGTNFFPLKAFYCKCRALVALHASNGSLDEWALYSFMCLTPQYGEHVQEYHRTFLRDAEQVEKVRVDARRMMELNRGFVFPVRVSAGFMSEFFFADECGNVTVVVEHVFAKKVVLKSLALVINDGINKSVFPVEEGLVLMPNKRCFIRKTIVPKGEWRRVSILEAEMEIGNVTVVLPLAHRVFQENMYDSMSQIARRDGYHVNVRYPAFGIVGVKPLVVVEASADEGKPKAMIKVEVEGMPLHTVSGEIEPGKQTTLPILLDEQSVINVRYQMEIGGIPCEPAPVTSFKLEFRNPLFINFQGPQKLTTSSTSVIPVQIRTGIQIPVTIKDIVLDYDEALVSASFYPIDLPLLLKPSERVNIVVSVTPLRGNRADEPWGSLKITYLPSEYFEEDCVFEFPFPVVPILSSPVTVDFRYPSTVGQYQPEEMVISLNNITKTQQTVTVNVASSDKVMIDGYTNIDVTLESEEQQDLTLMFFALEVDECDFPEITVMVNNEIVATETPDLFVIFTGN